MINRKNVLTILALITLSTGNVELANAEQSNLLQMDVKKSPAADTVDVTFFTTGDTSNTVVTRKSTNKYVVLLPNTTGNSSIVPSLGGVKDLVTDVQVKNVDDGIGGYTKVTFTTTKPINIKSATKKTAPLTQAQKDYKSLIAMNNNKPSANTAAKVSNASKTTTPIKPTVTNPQSVTKIQNTISETSKNVSQKSVGIKKKVENIITETSNIKKEQTKPVKSEEKNIETEQATTVNNLIQSDSKQSEKVETPVKPKKVAKQNKERNKIPFGNIPKKTLLYLFGGFAILMVLKSISNAMQKTVRPYQAMQPQEQPPTKESFERYRDILESKDMNWQEKYQKCEPKSVEEQPSNDLSYVTGIDKTQHFIVPQAKTQKDSIPSVNQPQRSKKFEEKIAKMEKLINQQPVRNQMPKPVVKKVENNISDDFDKISEVKLKSFANKTNSNRGKLVNNKQENVSMIKLNGSTLNNPKHNLTKDIQNNNDYSTSSLYEYLSIIDSVDQMNNTTATQNNRATNPIANKKKSNELKIKSGFNIDNNKSIYLVDSHGTSSIVGRINSKIFVIKKFNTIINSKLMLKKESQGTYIVGAGNYKARINVTNSNIGVLVEA